jgi:hypothetical protein
MISLGAVKVRPTSDAGAVSLAGAGVGQPPWADGGRPPSS